MAILTDFGKREEIVHWPFWLILSNGRKLSLGTAMENGGKSTQEENILGDYFPRRKKSWEKKGVGEFYAQEYTVMEEILLGEFSDWRKKSKENKMFLEKSTRSKRFWENKVPGIIMSGMRRYVEN